MEVIQKIKIDLLKPGVRPVVNVMQADENSRVIEIALYTNGVAWEIPDGASFSVAYKKPDGTSGLYDTLPDGTSASFAKGNVLSIRLAPQMLTVPGDVASSVAIFSSDQKISTFPVVVNVVQNPAAGATESEDYYWVSVLSAVGKLDDLRTTDKSSLVSAINEVLVNATGGITEEQIAKAVSDYLDENPVQAGATAEQAAQIEQNKNDIKNKVDKSGWAAGKFLGTDANGNVVAKEAPESGGNVDLTGYVKSVNGQAPDTAGNVSLELLKGEKGDKGDKGDPGAGYVLTDADKAAIAGLVDVPDAVTDEHINALIDAKLGVIENGTY